MQKAHNPPLMSTQLQEVSPRGTGKWLQGLTTRGFPRSHCKGLTAWGSLASTVGRQCQVLRLHALAVGYG